MDLTLLGQCGILRLAQRTAGATRGAREMPRYEAHPVDDNAGISGNPYGFAVNDSRNSDGKPTLSRNDVGPLMTEAEAGIIAFALNAIASGNDLSSTWDNGKERGVFETYSGPTEGVRA